MRHSNKWSYNTAEQNIKRFFLFPRKIPMARNVIPFQELRMTDVEQVGGKNASLGEMISQLPASVRVPGGFATTADAYREFLSHQGLAERISAALEPGRG
jgi:hypothetical protein